MRSNSGLDQLQRWVIHFTASPPTTTGHIELADGVGADNRSVDLIRGLLQRLQARSARRQAAASNRRRDADRGRR